MIDNYPKCGFESDIEILMLYPMTVFPPTCVLYKFFILLQLLSFIYHYG